MSRGTDPQYTTLEKWYHDDPHSLKRSTFNFLDENSIVFDLGGYEGQWTSDIYARYQCKVFVFEPVQAYAQMIRDRFIKNPKIQVFQIGIAHEDKELDISINTFASSVIKQKLNSHKETIQLKKFSSFLSEQNISCIDLIKINIEGSEFELLEKLIEEKLIINIRGLLIQFHNFVENADQRMKVIQMQLAKTHKPVFQYPFVWEYWERLPG